MKIPLGPMALFQIVYHRKVMTFIAPKPDHKTILQLIWHQKYFRPLPSFAIELTSDERSAKYTELQLIYRINGSLWHCHPARLIIDSMKLVISGMSTIVIPLNAFGVQVDKKAGITTLKPFFKILPTYQLKCDTILSEILKDSEIKFQISDLNIAEIQEPKAASVPLPEQENSTNQPEKDQTPTEKDSESLNNKVTNTTNVTQKTEGQDFEEPIFGDKEDKEEEEVLLERKHHH